MCDSKHAQLTRCAILLQLQALEHFTIGRLGKLVVPVLPPGADVDPMQLPALGYNLTYTSHQVLMLFRDLLYRQEANDVIWTPSKDEILCTLNPLCVDGKDSWRAEVLLICSNIVEWHYPLRVLRQFGWRSPLPITDRES
ncbi:hypothetical protein QQ045_019626 [Rhodiola kirilowii]